MGETPNDPSTLNAPTADPASRLNPVFHGGRTHQDAWVLTIVYHPDCSRIGERINWPSQAGQVVSVSRAVPAFSAATALGTGKPLGEIHMSRSPIRFESVVAGVRIVSEGRRTRLSIEGRPASEEELLTNEQLVAGVLLSLGGRVGLMLHPGLLRDVEPIEGLLGPSLSMSLLRQGIRNSAPHSLPILVSGESGSGKELVAEALHRLSQHPEKAFVAVNMAVLHPSTANAALFGHTKGAFTGANSARLGYFGEADGGTLFLDEIGETPADIQPMLLRAIELGQIHPMGGSSRAVQVRIVAATDADLVGKMADGSFRKPLFHRLSALKLRVAPLRERRVDVSFLLLHFLNQVLQDLGRLELLSTPAKGEKPWLGPELIAQLMSYDWPGNVRELKNVATAIVMHGKDSPSAYLPSDLAVTESVSTAPLLPSSGQGAALVKEQTKLSSPSQIDEASLRQNLEAEGWRVGAAARQMGISRNSLYSLMERYGIRHAAMLTQAEIELAMSEFGQDLNVLAPALKVSLRALKLRLKSLRITIE